MTNYFIIPGYGGSGPDHWQTYFENTQANFQRIHQSDWDRPNIQEWAATIDKVVAGYDPETVVLVAHSLGCIAVAEWAKRYNRNIKAALLVAPPDVEMIREKVDKNILDEAPTDKIQFKTIVVASSNDIWATIEKAELYAHHWGSEFINIGEAGHINSASGHGQWDEGLEILKSLG